MLRAPRAPSRIDVAWRLLTPLLALAFAFTAVVTTPDPVAAGGTSTVAVYRERQVDAAAAMRRADKQIERLQKQRGNHAKLLRAARRKLDHAIDRRKAIGRKADKAASRLAALELTLARETLVRPSPTGTQKIDKPKLRKRVRSLRQHTRQLDARVHQAVKKEAKARKLKQTRANKPTKSRLEARKSERERAEDRLSAAIYNMTALSKDRAGRFGTASVRHFAKPASGHVSQRFGCTGYAANPPRGSCRHFHDGVDIAAARGSRVRASADGFVAYVGFSPWDTGERAFIVIIGHAGGYESVYAHLQPQRKVRAGQKVKRGDVIGTIGMTGLTSGPHVHWEIRKSGTNLDPLKAGR
jgi:murein DD-endopeptidase MepM/ murein hydrolase activator NlpD